MVKEGFCEATSKNKIIIRFASDAEQHRAKFENGAFVVECKPEDFSCNIFKIASKPMENLL
jgi:hypothetical protein